MNQRREGYGNGRHRDTGYHHVDEIRQSNPVGSPYHGIFGYVEQNNGITVNRAPSYSLGLYRKGITNEGLDHLQGNRASMRP